MTHLIRVWDLPTRLFHWLLLACIVALFITGHVGGAAIHWHARLGLAVLALLVFRLVWGLVGGRWSRFSSFLYSPASVLAYLKGEAPALHRVGHNPLGAFSVFALLAVLAAQVGTGLVSDDEISFTGPLNRFVDSARALAATWYHKQIGQWLLVFLVVMHVAAIVWYTRRKGEVLVPAMMHGDKTLPHDAPASRDDGRTRLLALVIALAACGVSLWVSRLGG